MTLRTQLLTKNDCYKSGKKLDVKGIMVHSTGANNPNIGRYVPSWDVPKLDKCVHAFIGKNADGTIGTCQTLPWDMRGWHAGGAANNTHIGFEICEDNLTSADYFNAVYKEAVELCAKLCAQFNLDPLKDGVIICHSEGHSRGIASNHADVMHWFPKHGKSMDTFRAKVALTNLVPEVKPVTPLPTATLPTLKKGSKGNDVKTLQTALNKYGYKLTADGDFGKLTDAAVRDFQLGHRLNADGIVGVKTWAALGV